MLTDTHCHLTYPELAPQIGDVLTRAQAAGVSRLITIATSPADADRGMQMFAAEPRVFLAAGIHPHEAAKVGEPEFAALRTIHENPSPAWRGRVVGVGETGLDFHYDFATPEQQERVFRFQLELALKVDRPVIIHARKAEEQVCDILADYPRLAPRTVFHCYSGPPATTRRILDAGYWMSFTGVVTFKNGDDVRLAATLCPLDRIMVETDAPFLSPEPVRKIFPNEPAFVAHTAARIAALRGMSPADFARTTTANAERFFGLPKESI